MTKTILCADDSATMQKVAEITFAASDYTYVGARTADEALKLAKSEKPSLVLADALMPGKTGYDLCKAIKSDPDLAGVPVLLMCGNSQAYDAAKGDAAGADGHVIKPWDTQVMLDKVAEVLGRGAEGVASPTAAKTATPNPAAARQPGGAPKGPPMVVPSPAQASSPKSPPAPSPSVPQPPRSATIMGMPTFQLPPQGVAGPGAGQVPPGSSAGAPPPAAPNGGAATPPPARPAPVSAAPSGRQNAGASDGAQRPPMITGEPRRGLRLVPIQEVAAQVASEHGLDPVGPEMQALVKLSREVVERIVWEVVPDLAEAIIRQNLDKLTARAR